VSILATILAGLTGTVMMTLSMASIHHAGWARANMVRALGSRVTGKWEGAIKVGLVLHLTAGILFAFPYVFVISGVGPISTAQTILMGAVLGFVHGFVMSFILVAAVAEKHPIEYFRTAGFEVAAAHVFGHIAYGVGVALITSLMSIDFGIRL
jgi:uncharacterized membrane protein YagU involved in acid resistance